MVQILNKTNNGFFAYVSNPLHKYGVMGIESAKNLFDGSQANPKVLRVFEVGSGDASLFHKKNVAKAPLKAELLAHILDAKNCKLTEADISEIYQSLDA